MANKSTKLNATDKNKSISYQQHETDSPILPVAQLEKLHNFRPDIVDWVITQTQNESEYRRSAEKRINRYIFIERITGQTFALIIGITGIIGGAYIALNGHPTTGGTVATASLTGLAVVFITGRKQKQ